MTYLGILLVGGLLASSILGGITYFDTKRRGPDSNEVDDYRLNLHDSSSGVRDVSRRTVV